LNNKETKNDPVTTDGVDAIPSLVFSAQTWPRLDWASFAVERTAFLEAEPGRYGRAGKFDGIGMMYFSVPRMAIEFKGIKRIELAHLGQEANDKYEFASESFTIWSIKPTRQGEYVFEAVRDGAFARTANGTIRFAIPRSGVSGSIEYFHLEEHGQQIQGAMNQYTLPTLPIARDLLKKFDEIFFGGYVALEFDPHD
jgi:hypothetical protein